ncbi:MAG: segregation/condensation protein A [Smithellaceae bacterium]|nr:segregation/condensation protein A [Smithellaceae bacterium]
MTYEIKLDIFEGPLDLLLYLIKKNEIDIYNIPMAVVTEQYLDYIEMMKSLNLDLAGEYLVLASTLVHIKSRMLLPPAEDEEGNEEADPRAELVQQLLEYQAFKEAASQLEGRTVLDRDVFKRGYADPLPAEDDDEGEVKEIGIFELIEAFRRIVTSSVRAEFLDIDTEKLSLTERMNEVMDMLSARESVTFAELMGEARSRRRIIFTLLALLELMKQSMIRAYQVGTFGEIRIFLSVSA